MEPLISGITVSPTCEGLDKLPSITLTIDATDYELTADDYVLKVSASGETECILGIQSMAFPAGFDYFIVGDVFLRKYPAYFNLNDNSVSFMVANTIA